MLCTPLVVSEGVSSGNPVLEALSGTAGLAPHDEGRRWRERNGRKCDAALNRSRKQVYLFLPVHVQGATTNVCYHSSYWDQT